ncbi:hypothetical protein H8356DRAFT_1357007 [Neocallimastix lanati (nom. inval.)]|nr:hypothetical protein H8356DRAFT_1357007 [Neocallimastix sp. JGI-2020a]
MKLFKFLFFFTFFSSREDLMIMVINSLFPNSIFYFLDYVKKETQLLPISGVLIAAFLYEECRLEYWKTVESEPDETDSPQSLCLRRYLTDGNLFFYSLSLLPSYLEDVNFINRYIYIFHFGGISALDELQFDTGETGTLNCSQGSSVPYMVGLAEYFANALPIISSSLELLFERFSKKTPSLPRAPIWERNIQLLNKESTINLTGDHVTTHAEIVCCRVSDNSFESLFIDVGEGEPFRNYHSDTEERGKERFLGEGEETLLKQFTGGFYRSIYCWWRGWCCYRVKKVIPTILVALYEIPSVSVTKRVLWVVPIWLRINREIHRECVCHSLNENLSDISPSMRNSLREDHPILINSRWYLGLMDDSGRGTISLGYRGNSVKDCISLYSAMTNLIDNTIKPTLTVMSRALRHKDENYLRRMEKREKSLDALLFLFFETPNIYLTGDQAENAISSREGRNFLPLLMLLTKCYVYAYGDWVIGAMTNLIDNTIRPTLTVMSRALRLIFEEWKKEKRV